MQIKNRTCDLHKLGVLFLNELGHYRPNWAPFDLIAAGTYPRVHQEKLTPRRFFNGYNQTYIERDVRSLINIRDLRAFQQFLALLAGRVGQIVNFAGLSNDIGVSATTIKTRRGFVQRPPHTPRKRHPHIESTDTRWDREHRLEVVSFLILP